MAESARSKGQRAKSGGTFINEGDHLVSDWVITAEEDNALATATKAAESGKRHYIVTILASYSGTKTGNLEVKDGSTSLFNFVIENEEVIPLSKPLPISEGNALNVELEASGTGGELGDVTVIGYTA